MVRFLHIADKPFTTWKEEGGRVLPRIAKPNGFWIARDLTWVTLMDQARDWTPRPDKEAPGREPMGRIHAAVSHAVDGTDIAVATEGEAKPLPWVPLFVYVLEIPESSFSTDLDTPDPTQILRISRANLDALLAGYASFLAHGPRRRLRVSRWSGMRLNRSSRGPTKPVRKPWPRPLSA